MANSCGYHSLVAFVKAAFEHEQIRDSQEYLGVAALYLLLELGVLLCCAFNQLTEADVLFTRRLGHQVGPTETPGFLEPCHQVH